MTRKNGAWLVILILVVLCFFGPLATGSRFFYYKDLMSYVFPLKSFQAQSLRAGDFPLWIPHLYLGSPYLAQIDNGALYPLNVLYLLFPVQRAFTFIAIINYLIAAVSMFLLSRRWVGCPWASFTASVSYALGGYMVFAADNPLYLFSGALIPLCFYCADRALACGALRWCGLSALVMAVQLSGGDPQTVLYEGFFLLLWALWRRPAAHSADAGFGAGMLNRVLPVALAGLLMAGLMAAVLVPSVELIKESSRLEAVGYDEATGWSLAPQKLLDLAVPYLFGLGKAGNLYLGEKPWVNSIFMGYLPLVLAPFALGSCRANRAMGFAGAMGGLSLLVALGRYTPVYRALFEHIPLFSGFRYPIKAFIFVAFALCLLAAGGFKRVISDASGDRSGRNTLAAAFVSLFLAAGLLMMVGLANRESAKDRVGALLERHEIKELPGDVIANGTTRGARAAVHLFAIGAGLMIVRVGFRRGNRVKLAGLGLVFIHCAGVLPATHEASFFWTGPLIHETIPATVKAMDKTERSGAPSRVFSFDLLVNKHLDYGLGLNPWEEQKLWDRTTLTFNHAVLFGFSYFKGYASLKPARFAMLEKQMALKSLPAVASTFGVNYLVVPPLGGPSPRFFRPVQTGEPGPFEMYRNLQAVPRLFLVKDHETAGSAKEALARVLQPGFDPRRHVVLERPASRVPKRSAASAMRAVTYTRFLPDTRVFSVECEEPMFLVECEQWFPGWKALVDGRPVALERANFLMRALEIPKGKHEVILRYAPWSFRTGALISLASLAMALAAIASKRKVWFHGTAGGRHSVSSSATKGRAD